MPDALKILHLITDLDIGGAEVMLARLLARMDRQRFDNTVVVMLPPGPVAETLRADKIPVVTLSMRRGVPHPLAIVRLRAILRRIRPTILQTWLYHADVLGLLTGRFTRVPVVVWNLRSSDMEMSKYGVVSALVRPLGAWLSRQPDAIIVNSIAGRSFHERIGYRPGNWFLIPNGIDTDIFKPNHAMRGVLRQGLGLDASTVLIGLIARYDRMKDHRTFIRAAGEASRVAPEAHFVLAGDDITAANSTLRAWIAEANLDGRVHLLGLRHDIASIAAALDVAVSSSAFGEGFPTVVAEAMACGVPCVVTDVGDAARLVGSTGIVVPPRNASALADGLRTLIERGAAARRQLGLAARARIAEQFSLATVVQRYQDLYSSLADRVPRAS